MDNVGLNRVEDKVKVFSAGVWLREGELDLSCEGTRSGLYTVSFETVRIRIEPLDKVLRRVSIEYEAVVKMDCEGCEYSILRTPCNVLRTVAQYIIEIHGASKPLIDCMKCCGFRAEIVKELAKELVPVEVWLFTRRDASVQR